MNRGKWYLVYTTEDIMESHAMSTCIKHEEVPLDATTEDEAFAEAKKKWFDIETKANAELERMKKLGHTFKTAFYGQSPNPRVIYKILLQ